MNRVYVEEKLSGSGYFVVPFINILRFSDLDPQSFIRLPDYQI